MDILLAFTAMIQDVQFGDVSERQIDGIRDWYEMACQAAGWARQLNASPDCLDVIFAGSATHRTWRTSSEDILAALKRQENETAHRRVAAELEADEQDLLAQDKNAAAAAERMRAAAARARASAARIAGAAAVVDPAAAAALEAEAAAAEAEAVAADGEAALAEARAAALEAEAEQHRQNAEDDRELAAELHQWEMAARDAYARGTQLLADEQPIAARVYEGIQAAGGLHEVAAGKRYATRGGSPVLTGGGWR